jgi:AcrR family transcriptional regulator
VPAAPLSAELRQKIHETVISLTTRHGLDGWRISDLVDATGVSSRTIYKYFPSKEHLLLTSLVETSEIEYAKIRETTMRRARTPRTRVLRALQECTEGVMDSPELAQAMVRAWTSGQASIPPLLAGFEEGLKGTLAYVMAGGPPSPAQEKVAEVIEMVWVTSVIAWTSGLRERDFVDTSIRRALSVIELPG